MEYVLVIATILPVILLIREIYRADRLEHEPIGLIMKLLIFGVFSALIAIVMEIVGGIVLSFLVSNYSPLYKIIDNFIIIALSEELSKYWLLKWGSYKHKAFNCMFDGIVYATAVSLGFALFENILYVADGGLSTALVRAFTAIPGHCCFGVFMGIWYGYAKKMSVENEKEAEKNSLRKCVLIPTFLHGLYDYILSLELDFIIIIFIIVVIMMFSLATKIVKKVSKDDFYIDGGLLES